MRDVYDLPGTPPIIQVEADMEEERLEERATQLRQDAHEKLEQVREKLSQARKDLESSSTEKGVPKRNPFGRKTAALKQLTDELQAAPAPILNDSRQPEAEAPPPIVYDVPLEFVDPDELAIEIESEDLANESHNLANENSLDPK